MTQHEKDLANFATFGREVAAAEVPALVNAGVEVWAFNYGDPYAEDEDGNETDERAFTTLDPDDVTRDSFLPEWGPFRAVLPVDEDSDFCRKCGGPAHHDDRPFDSDNLCWDCHRELPEGEQ